MSIVFAYHSPDPANFKPIGDGACVGRTEVQSMSGENNRMATAGAEQLELPPGRYIAVQEDSDRPDVIIGWSWIIEVEPPHEGIARVVK